MTETPFLVQLAAVSKTYGDHMVKALSNVNLNVKAGEFVALMGPSGCGKSTLLNIVGGIDKPTDGKVLLEGKSLVEMGDEKLTALRRTNIGFVFQFFNLLTTLTVFENVALPLELENIKKKELTLAVNGVLQRVGMESRKDFYPSQLSGGEMQRVAIARALVHSPRIVVADEPTGNLDSENGTAVLELIREINVAQGTTVIMATHSQEAAGYAQRIIEMRDGGIVGERQCSARP
jgi:putative ABC transport system ATP-binding protein